jgi:hypothetical protein
MVSGSILNEDHRDGKLRVSAIFMQSQFLKLDAFVGISHSRKKVTMYTAP